MESFQSYIRRLPHWRISGSMYFLTMRIYREQPYFAPEEKSIIAGCFKFFNRQRYDLYTYVVMDDHCHVIVLPFPDHRIEKITHSWLSFSAHELQKRFFRVGSIWHREPYDRLIRSDTDLLEKARYIIENPWRRNPTLLDYPWVGSKIWLYGGIAIQDTHLRPAIDILP